METIEEKYHRLRLLIRDGDTILVRNPKNIGKVISFCDKAKWTHVLSCQWATIAGERRLLSLEAGFEGVDIGFMSSHIKMYSDFIVLQPNRSKNIIETALSIMVNKAEIGVHYAYKGGIAGLLERFLLNYLGIKVKIYWGNKDEVMCSTWEQSKVYATNITDYENIWRMFPHDFIRYLNPDNFDILT